VAGAPTQRPRKLSKRGRARCGTHRTGLILAVLRRRGGLWGGDRLATLGTIEEGATHYRVGPDLGTNTLIRSNGVIVLYL
jgi:hypothetical protein